MAIDLISQATTGCELMDKVNEIINNLNTVSSGVAVPVGAIIPFYGNPEDADNFDASGIGVVGSHYASFAFCWGQALTGSLLTEQDGTPKSLAPDFRGKAIVQRNPSESEFANIGQTGGAKTHTLTISELAEHNHGIRSLNGTSPLEAPGLISGDGSPIGYSTTSDESAMTYAGDGTPHNNLQPYAVTEYLIRYK
jgi:microcystin-dependent protein